MRAGRPRAGARRAAGPDRLADVPHLADEEYVGVLTHLADEEYVGVLNPLRGRPTTWSAHLAGRRRFQPEPGTSTRS